MSATASDGTFTVQLDLGDGPMTCAGGPTEVCFDDGQNTWCGQRSIATCTNGQQLTVSGTFIEFFTGIFGSDCNDVWVGTIVPTTVAVTTSTIATTTSTSTTSAPESSTSTTLGGVDSTPPFCVEPGTIIPPQSPDCAGPTSAYVQTYQFCGHLVSNTCAPWFEPREPVIEPRLRVEQAGANKALSGVVRDASFNDSATPDLTIEASNYDVTGRATYPEWETQGPLNVRGVIAVTPDWIEIGGIGAGMLWTAMDGLPRQRAGCQQVSGAVEARVATPVECVIRYEGAWTWLDN